MAELTTIDDIIFENRNKEYGSYYFRKNFGKILTRATILGTVIMTALLAGSFFFTKIAQEAKEREILVDLSASDLDEDQPEEEKLDIPEDIPPPPPEEIPEVAQEKFLPPEPKKDEDVLVEEPPPPVEKLEKAVISSKTVEGVEAVDVFIPPPPPKEVEVVKVEKPAEEQIFVGVEQMPEYPGGNEAIYKFLGKEIQYPAAATRANVSGRVTLQFVVEKDGTVGAVNVMKGIGFGCDEEAVRAVKELTKKTKFRPGMQNGKPVRVWYTLPVVFNLQD